MHNKMKKLLTVLLCLLFVVGCTANNAAPEEETEDPSEGETTE